MPRIPSIPMAPFRCHLVLFLSALLLLRLGDSAANPVPSSQPMNPEPSTTVPAFPVQSEAQACRLDLSTELFGGVAEACGQGLDRSRCCPVLAAWLYAAHARSALQPSGHPPSDLPVMPEDSQRCVVSLQASLQGRGIALPQPNATCDTVLCFCGIRLHQIGSLSCPAAFNLSAVPTSAVRRLESSCGNSSYAGCTRCLTALQKVRARDTELASSFSLIISNSRTSPTDPHVFFLLQFLRPGRRAGPDRPARWWPARSRSPSPLLLPFSLPISLTSLFPLSSSLLCSPSPFLSSHSLFPFPLSLAAPPPPLLL